MRMRWLTRYCSAGAGRLSVRMGLSPVIRFATFLMKSAFHTAVGLPVQYPYRMSPKAFRDSSKAGGTAVNPARRDSASSAATGRPTRRDARRERTTPQRVYSTQRRLRPLDIALFLLCAAASAAVSAWIGLRHRSPNVVTTPEAVPSPVHRGSAARPRADVTAGRPRTGAMAGATASPVAVPSPLPLVTPSASSPQAADSGPAGPAPTSSQRRDSLRNAQVFADVAFVAETHGPQVRACYERAFRHDAAAPSGRVELSFTLVDAGDFGRAVDIRTELNLLGNAVVASCLAEIVGEWRFPRPAGGQPQPVRYPFLFSASDP